MTKDEILAGRVPPAPGRKRRSKVHGIGINDAWFRTAWKISGRKTVLDVSYSYWSGILERCYSLKLHAKYPSYIGCSVCEEWLTFSNFDRWFLENYKEDFDIDKDILHYGNKIYSPETCLFVPHWVNSFITASNANRGPCSLGVSYHKRDKVFEVMCKDPLEKKHRYIGRFKTEEEAHSAWLEAKLDVVYRAKDELDLAHPRLFNSLIETVKQLR